MDEAAFQEQLSELLVEIQKYPELEKKKLGGLTEDATKRQKKLKSSIANLQNSLDYLRLSIKYLTFDLEATKRENRVLRRMLEEGM
jgi:hypothetical protein